MDCIYPCYPCLLSSRTTAYLRLVVLAAAFQHTLKRGMTRQSDVFKKALDAAKAVISIMIERLYPSGHLRFAMEADFLHVAYAAAFLMNVSGRVVHPSVTRLPFPRSCCAQNSFRSLRRKSNVKSYILLLGSLKF